MDSNLGQCVYLSRIRNLSMSLVMLIIWYCFNPLLLLVVYELFNVIKKICVTFVISTGYQLVDRIGYRIEGIGYLN